MTTFYEVVNQSQPQPRFQYIPLGTPDQTVDHGEDVIQGLSQVPKTLPCRYFYDDQGSLLFEQICTLPEYYPTRTERRILTTAAAEIAEFTGGCELVELGSGSSSKTRLLLDAYSQLAAPLHYCPIDVSGGMLKTSALELLDQYPQLHICGRVGTYEQALVNLSGDSLGEPTRVISDPDLPRLLIFLGSTIGNLDAVTLQKFLLQVQQALRPGDYFLLGVDLQKSIEILEPAYNDAQGITAAFNLNCLRHLNWRFNGNFDLSQFAHWAFYNTAANQIEMHLRSLVSQTVTLQTLNFRGALAAAETIQTEISRKFDLPTLKTELQAYQLQPLHSWTDPQHWFALLLCQRSISA
ncbi:methyltransferase [Neosynechococcus sphagnicola sy1]|uniref:Methyltransferase n=1 Tax=Neosynechococcus sphagnicola sy1 TaxID=1497020 RepID=A0A098TL10_9CYAN|nr:L-histidine N(alpha)-methyltransferase [Neosynechococcus sphagnicola]KGF73010.1 methyltransferase [Neosynechococcus sphagnicola sy1]